MRKTTPALSLAATLTAGSAFARDKIHAMDKQ